MSVPANGVSAFLSRNVGAIGAVRGAILATVVYALTPEGATALASMGVPAPLLAGLAFLGTAIRTRSA